MSRPDDQCTRCLQMGHRASQCKQPTADARAHLGVRTVEDIRQRCRIDTETKCWLWSMAIVRPNGTPTPVVHVSPHVLDMGRKPTTMPAARAAWLLSGHKLNPGDVVWRSVCGAGMCVNPAHLKAGPKSAMYADVSASGRNRGKPERAVVNAKNRQRMLCPPEKVQQAERLFAAGLMQKDVASQVGIDKATARRIRLGTHPNCSTSPRVVGGASVFAWRPA